MIDPIQQGLDKVNDLSETELDSLIASAFSEFEKADAAGDSDGMREYLVAARTLSTRKQALKASADGDGGNEPAAEATGSEPTTTTADASATDVAETPTAAESTESAVESTGPVETSTETPSEAVAADASGTEQAVQAADVESEPATEATPASADEPPEADPAPADAEAQAETPITTTSEETTVTASASVDDQTIEVAEDNKPIVASSAPMPSTILAGMDVQGISAGSPFKTVEDVGKAFVHRIRAVNRASGGDGEKHTVATIAATYPEERILDGDFQKNSKKIEAVLNQAMVASGGFCAPLPVRYDIFGLGVTDRPVRDALMMFNANRGGVRFVTPPVLTDLADAVGVWTSTVDATPGTATKAELKVTCAQEVDADSDAITLQLEFGNFMSRAYPELVNRNNELGLIQHARIAELELLSKMSALSTDVTAATKLGVAIDFLNSIARGASAYRNRHRMRRNTPLRVIAPDWVLDAMRTDLSQRIPGDDTVALADAQIQAYLNAQNVRVSWHLDSSFAAQSSSAPLVEYPATFDWYLFAEGSFLFLDGGTLDIGVVRDSALVSTNDYKTFMETFEGVAMIGVESLVVTQESVIEGASVGTIAPFGS